MVAILPITKWPIAGFEPLLRASREEGFRFLHRLDTDWISGKNRFEQTGEALYGLFLGDQLIGLGGINLDPYARSADVGRLRRFYILPAHRRQGLGRSLCQHIFDQHQAYFREIRLRTDQKAAANFYTSIGFSANPEAVQHTHALILK
ncbi:MAG: GNAT family N-acetyltransferase [Bacteroidota bacterium]